MYSMNKYIYPSIFYKDHVKAWFLYIDDIFVIWEGDTIILQEFVSFLNAIFPGIVFNPKVSTQSLSFLDVMVSIKDSRFVTTVFS